MTLSSACRRLAGRYVAAAFVVIAVWSQTALGSFVTPHWLAP